MKHASIRMFGWAIALCIFGGIIGSVQVSGQQGNWKNFEGQIFQVADIVIQRMIQGNLQEEDIAALYEETTQLDMAFSGYAQQCPSQQACEALRYILLKMQEVVDMAAGGINSAEEGKSLASLRQAVHNYKASGGYRQQQGQQQKVDRKIASSDRPAGKLNFAVGVLYQPRGSNKFVELKDQGIMQSGDYYKVVFAASQSCHVYVFQVDSTNKIYGMFPLENFREVQLGNMVNPISPGKKYIMPGKDKSFVLDQQTGIEQIYVMVLRQQDVQLEQQYQMVVRAQNEQNTEYMQVAQAGLMRSIHARGIAGVDYDAPQEAASRVSVESDDGQQSSVLLQRLQNCENCVKVFTFNHQ